MFTKRIIPCLDVNNGRVVKGVNFVDLKDAGDPVTVGAAYGKAGADELVFLDITASSDERATKIDMVRRVAETVFIPFTVGSEIAAGVKNVHITDCLFMNTDRGLRVKTRRGRGKLSVLDDISFENIDMDNVMTPFVVNSFYFCDPDGKTNYVGSKEPLPVDDRTPSIKRLTFRNIKASNCHVAGAYIYGLPESKIEKLTFENIDFTYAKDAKPGVAAMMLGCDVTFDGVDFGYNPDKIVLHDIKMFAKPGQKLAFVGSTGAGKTTITNLINRFYDIQDGKIRYDGININHIKKDDLRRSLGIVLQDTNLFTGTIMDNIRYGRLNAADEECIAAAKLANADGFIKRLPDGYNTVLTGGGANLSQGQRQLLAIARAAVADPPVLILDEATSSIDTRTEKLVQRGMDALMTGRTSFVIAHRLSTVRNADCIMVMEQGRIIERGTHDQLMEEKGRYYQLYTGKSISA